jgi:hypothetical protein
MNPVGLLTVDELVFLILGEEDKQLTTEIWTW